MTGRCFSCLSLSNKILQMKQARILILTSIVTLSLFALVVYSSCSKASCSGIVCQNGGTCSKGSCSCPPGYSGSQCQSSSITFQNNTFTIVDLSVNGAPATLQPGSSIAFAGPPGSTLKITATTSGISPSGTQVGQTIAWAIIDTIPSGGKTFTQPFDIGSAYFFLQVINDDPSQYINTVYVNYGSPLQTTDNVSLPNDRNIYPIGYYRSSANTEVYLAGSSGGAWALFPGIPTMVNATVTVKAN